VKPPDMPLSPPPDGAGAAGAAPPSPTWRPVTGWKVRSFAGRCARKEEHWTCLMLSKPATRMKQSGNARVHARTSARTSSGEVQPYMGSFHITQ